MKAVEEWRKLEADREVQAKGRAKVFGAFTREDSK